MSNYIWGPFYQYGLTLFPAWISNYIRYKVWDEINHPFPGFNAATVEVGKWISNCIPHYTRHVILIQIQRNLNHVSKRGLGCFTWVWLLSYVQIPMLPLLISVSKRGSRISNKRVQHIKTQLDSSQNNKILKRTEQWNTRIANCTF